MILEGTITKPTVTEQATIEVYSMWGYDSINKQVIVTCKVSTGGEVFEKQYPLTSEQTELWGEDDNYVIDMICQENGFTIIKEPIQQDETETQEESIEQQEETLPVEEPIIE